MFLFKLIIHKKKAVIIHFLQLHITCMPHFTQPCTKKCRLINAYISSSDHHLNRGTNKFAYSLLSTKEKRVTGNTTTARYIFTSRIKNNFHL